MPFYYITETNFDPSVITKYEKLLNWFEQTLSPEYHIFIEFKVPFGREVDFLIIAQHGAWLIEHKQHDFMEIISGGKWKYRDRRGGIKEYVKRVKTGYENPYAQAINSGDNFRDWLYQHRSIANDLGQRKTVFPCVAFPDSSTNIQILERDRWCYLSKGTTGIQDNIHRKWNQSDWISEETIKKIASVLSLQQITFSDLVQHRANLENIFQNTGKNQIEEIKSLLAQTNQLNDSNDWIYSIQVKKFNARFSNIELTEISLEFLPFLLSGEFGSGKSIACSQIMELFLKENLGFVLPVRDIITSKIDETSKKFIFKGKDLVYSINIEQDSLENVKDDIANIIAFIVETLIKIYNKKGLLEQVKQGIANYLLDQRFFIILDGWDEIQSGSFNLMKKILDYFLLNDIPVIVSCRNPLDNYLKQLKTQDKEISIYHTLPPPEEQMKLYIAERLKAWTNTVSVDEILTILRGTFGSNITPFHLYATTIVPIAEPPKNSAQLIRWMIIAQVGWELLKNRKDYFKSIRTLQDLIQILEKEKIIVSQKEISMFNAIFDFQETNNEVFPNGSIKGIVGKIAFSEIDGTNIELSGSSALEINPLITPFVDLIPHPEGLYSYPRVNTKLLQDYFIAESTLEELVAHGNVTPLISLDVFFLFSNLLEIDERWKASLKAQGKEDDANKLSVQYLTTYPVKLRPTIKKPDFEVIGGGMRTVQSRMRLGIPKWYIHLLSACIKKIKSLITFSSDLVSQNDAITSFLQLQQTVPEITSDRIYDSFIKDDDEPQFSQSLEPEYFLKNVMIIFAEYKEKRSTIMDKIDVYCRKMKAKEADRKKEKQDKEEDEDWYDYPIDTYFCDCDTYRKLSFLFSILEYSGSTDLKQWAEQVISNISLNGDLISYLLLENIPLAILNSLLLRYQQIISSYIDGELGVLQPGDYDFDEEIIIKSFIRNTILGAPQRTLETFWILLIHYSNDLNLIELLFNNKELFDINTLSLLYRITLLHYFDDYPKKKPQVELLIQNIDKLKPISMILTYDNFISISSKRIPITQDELQWLLNENLDKITEGLIKSNSTKYKKLLVEKKDFLSLDSRNQLIYLLKGTDLKNKPTWEVRERFEIFQIALLYDLEIEPTDLAAITLEFDQINWILQFLKLKQVNIPISFKMELFSSFSTKIKVFKSLIEEDSFNPMKIAFYRLITRQTRIKSLYNIQLTNKEVESWLRESLIHEENKMNDDWIAIEKLISSRLITYFENSEFKDYFSEIVKSDTEAKVNPKHFAGLMFPSYFYNSIKDDRYNWKDFNQLITDEFFSRTLKIAMKEPHINGPVFSLVFILIHTVETRLIIFYWISLKKNHQRKRVYIILT